MPSYAHFKEQKVKLERTATKMATLAKLGVPYSESDCATAPTAAREQGGLIAADLAVQSVTIAPDSEMAAVIAYLQRLGRATLATAAAAAPAATKEAS